MAGFTLVELPGRLRHYYHSGRVDYCGLCERASWSVPETVRSLTADRVDNIHSPGRRGLDGGSARNSASRGRLWMVNVVRSAVCRSAFAAVELRGFGAKCMGSAQGRDK